VGRAHEYADEQDQQEDQEGDRAAQTEAVGGNERAQADRGEDEKLHGPEST
jgi:hypothetical protein